MLKADLRINTCRLITDYINKHNLVTVFLMNEATCVYLTAVGGQRSEVRGLTSLLADIRYLSFYRHVQYQHFFSSPGCSLRRDPAAFFS